MISNVDYWQTLIECQNFPVSMLNVWTKTCIIKIIFMDKPVKSQKEKKNVGLHTNLECPKIYSHACSLDTGQDF